jgi:hypothetical protein
MMITRRQGSVAGRQRQGPNQSSPRNMVSHAAHPPPQRRSLGGQVPTERHSISSPVFPLFGLKQALPATGLGVLATSFKIKLRINKSRPTLAVLFFDILRGPYCLVSLSFPFPLSPDVD